MKQINTKQLVVVIGGFLAAFLVFPFFIVNAAHFSGNKIQNQKNNDWFNPAYRCQTDELEPMISKSTGDVVVKLQNCLRFLNESYVPMDGRWDRETRKSVKWFYKHFLGKKSNGKKFDAEAIQRMKELAAIAEPFLEIPPPEKVSETLPEDVVNKSVNLKQEVDRILTTTPAWQKEIEEKAASYGVKLSEKEILKKQQVEGIEITFHDIVKWSARARKEVKKKDYEQAYRFTKMVEEAYLRAPNFFEELDKEVALKQQRAAGEKEAEEAQKKYEAEEKARFENFIAQKAEKISLGKETLEKISQYFRFTVPAGYIALRNSHDDNRALFRATFIPEDTEFWTDDQNKINFYESPSVAVESNRVMEGYTFEVFEKEMQGIGTEFSKGGSDDDIKLLGKKIMLDGVPWYRLDKTALALGKDTAISTSVSTVRNGFLYQIELNEGVNTPNASKLKKVREDFERMVKSIKVQQ